MLGELLTGWHCRLSRGCCRQQRMQASWKHIKQYMPARPAAGDGWTWLVFTLMAAGALPPDYILHAPCKHSHAC